MAYQTNHPAAGGKTDFSTKKFENFEAVLIAAGWRTAHLQVNPIGWVEGFKNILMFYSFHLDFQILCCDFLHLFKVYTYVFLLILADCRMIVRFCVKGVHLHHKVLLPP